MIRANLSDRPNPTGEGTHKHKQTDLQIDKNHGAHMRLLGFS